MANDSPHRSNLIERMYEAAVIPELWPSLLSDLGRACGAAGGLFFTNSLTNFSWIAAPEVAWIIEEYVAQGWIAENERGAPMIAELCPSFRTDNDFRSAEQRAILPVYRDFLIPHGIDAAAGTVIQGAADDAIVLTIEHFPSHQAASAAIPFLDSLRPHLGRALSLASRISSTTADTTVKTLGHAGVAAAIVSADGRLRAANDRFNRRLADKLDDRQSGLCFVDPVVQAQFAGALLKAEIESGSRSIAVAARDDQPACAVHVLPLRRGARDVFGWDGILVLVAEPSNASVPGADLLRLLFDLTPTEARLTRQLLNGHTSSEAARTLGITDNTARTHLRRIFLKLGVQRQSDLMRLLLGLGVPSFV